MSNLSQRNLESEAKRQLEEVYSEECQTDFDSEQFQVPPIEILPIQSNEALLSGWDQTSKPKRDKSCNDSPNKLARNTLSCLGENIERYQSNPRNRITCEKLNKQHTSSQRRVRTMNLPHNQSQLSANTLSFTEAQQACLGNILNSLQNSRRGTFMHSELIGRSRNTQEIQRKFNMDFHVYRSRLKSVDGLELTQPQTQVAQETEHPIHFASSGLLNEIPTNPLNSVNARANSACWLRYESERQNRSREIMNSSQPKLLQIKIVSSPASHLFEQENKLNDSLSPTSFQKNAQHKRINLYKRSFQSAVLQLQQGTSVQKDRYASQTQQIDKNNMSDGRICPSSNMSSCSQERINVKQAHTSSVKKTRYSTETSLPMEITPTRQLTASIEQINKKSHSAQIIDTSNQSIIDQSSQAKQQQQQPINRLNLKAGSASNNLFTKLLSKQATTPSEDLIQLSAKKQSALSVNLNSKYEAVRHYYKQNCHPISLRANILHKRFESTKKSSISHLQLSPEKLNPIHFAPDEEEKQLSHYKLDPQSKPSTASHIPQKVLNQINQLSSKLQERLIGKRDTTPNITTKAVNRGLISNSSNKLQASYNYSSLAKSVAFQEFKDNHMSNIGCIQDNFLYKRILNND